MEWSRRDALLNFFKEKFPALPDNKHNILLQDEDNGNFDHWYFDYANFQCMVPIGKFKELNEGGTVRNFIYDRKLETVFVNFAGSAHPAFMASLLAFHYLSEGKPIPNGAGRSMTEFPHTFLRGRYESLQDFSANWLDEYRGFYVSSVSKRLIKDDEMKLNAQEKMIFRGYVTMEI